MGKIEFQIQVEETDPELAENWFKSFVQFGYLLGRQIDSGGTENLQALLMVPNKCLVAASICLGLSLQRFKSQKELGEKLTDPSSLEKYMGRRLRIELPGRYIIGDLIGFTQKSEKDIRVKLASPIDEEISLKLVRSLTLLPAEFPIGKYSISVPDAAEPKSEFQMSLDRFRSQGAPSAIVFTQKSSFQEELDSQIESDAFTEILGSNSFRLLDIARFDYLSPVDTFPHFVNVLESSARFPEEDSPEREVMNMCDVRIMDGNVAIERLALRDDFVGKFSLAIFELGEPHLSDQALVSFRSSLMYSKPSDIHPFADWKTPNGVSLTFWERA